MARLTRRDKNNNNNNSSGNRPAMPRVIISAAVSVDGKISLAGGRRGPRSRARAPARLSSESDVSRVHRLRAKCDAILVGVNTVLSDDPLLTVRHARAGRKRGGGAAATGSQPVRVVLDSMARTPPASKVAATSPGTRTIIAVSGTAPERRILALRRTGAEVVTVGRKAVDVRRLLSRLAKDGIRSVLVEGGGTTNWEFLRRSLVDEIVVAVSPYVLGGGLRGAVSLVEGSGFPSVSGSPKLSLRSARRLGDHVILSYDVGAGDGGNGNGDGSSSNGDGIRRPRRAGSRT